MLISSSKYSSIELKFFVINLEELNALANSSIDSLFNSPNAAKGSSLPIIPDFKITTKPLKILPISSSFQSLALSNPDTTIFPSKPSFITFPFSSTSALTNFTIKSFKLPVSIEDCDR